MLTLLFLQGEADGKDECLCPCDMNILTDNDLHALLAPLSNRPGVKLTFIAGDEMPPRTLYPCVLTV